MRDFWFRYPTLSQKKLDELDVMEHLVYKNQLEFNSVMHKLQIFQKELMHFTNNLEYYIKTRAIKQCCNELDNKL